MSDVVGFIIFIIFCGFFVYGGVAILSPEYSYPDEYFRAQEICIKNDGVEKMEYDELSIDVYCLDGAKFYIGRTK